MFLILKHNESIMETMKSIIGKNFGKFQKAFWKNFEHIWLRPKITKNRSTYLILMKNVAMLLATTYYDKTFEGETCMVHQQYSVCREKFSGLLKTTYFSVLIIYKYSVVKQSRLAKICKTENYPPQMFYHIWYLVYCYMLSCPCFF